MLPTIIKYLWVDIIMNYRHYVSIKVTSWDQSNVSIAFLWWIMFQYKTETIEDKKRFESKVRLQEPRCQFHQHFIKLLFCTKVIRKTWSLALHFFDRIGKKTALKMLVKLTTGLRSYYLLRAMNFHTYRIYSRISRHTYKSDWKK